MDDLFVGRVMSTDLHTVAPETLVADAAELMLDNCVGSVLVVENGELRGILTRTDFVDIVAKSRPKAATPVSDYMTADVVTTTAQDPIRDVANTMTEHGFHHMPVVSDEEGVIGMMTSADLAAYLSHVQTPSPA
ncbi:CBS domain-containing protein [Halococcus thailandensis]|uniref:Signal-transduction protein containing camp-binding and cbs domains n=1 Tax=Halococcus thailandensis JCM 13552 TaxID=1227457 RepID=M0N0V3_9EURY|nr:CBS domain-containing protein [Halococcus thailandensis]EMA51476.1 signal-transduction protein containing camp-binding and cbs domains [Halococcus thailandensis JCM 13552]